MVERRKKRRRKSKSSGTTGSGSTPMGVSPSSGGGGGGWMQGIRSGFRRAAGVEQRKEKASTLSNVIWTLILLAALGFAIYRWTA